MLKLLWLAFNLYAAMLFLPRSLGTSLQSDLFALFHLAVGALLLGLARRRWAPTYTSLTLSSLALLSLLLLTPHGCCRCAGKLTACKSNLKNLATGLEMWASDHRGAYPSDLNQLVGENYLQNIPTCPAARRDTYSRTYRRKGSGFELSCGGCHHHDANLHQPDYPRYDSQEGPIFTPP